MSKILKSDTGLYLQLSENKGCLGVYLTGDINSATKIPDEDAVVLRKYLSVEIIDVPPKWGIFYNGDMEDGYIEKQQLICYPLSNLSGDTGDIVVGFHPVHDLNQSLKPITFDNYNDAAIYAIITRDLLPHVDDIYVEKI